MIDLLLVGTFGNEITLDAVCAALEGKDLSGGINVIINSEGGDLLEAIRISNYLLGLNVPLMATAVLVASAATWLFLDIQDRQIDPSANEDWLFVHNATLSVDEMAGNLSAEDLRTIANKVDVANQQLAEKYALEFGISIDEAKDLMAKNTWLDDQQAKEYQLVALLNLKDMNLGQSLLKELQGLKQSFAAVVKNEQAPPMGAGGLTPDPNDPEEQDEVAQDKVMIETLKKTIADLQSIVDANTAQMASYESKMKGYEAKMSEKDAMISDAMPKLEAALKQVELLNLQDLKIKAEAGKPATKNIDVTKLNQVERTIMAAQLQNS
jgi:ATP-dependent protease ClpP protease subunit